MPTFTIAFDREDPVTVEAESLDAAYQAALPLVAKHFVGQTNEFRSFSSLEEYVIVNIVGPDDEQSDNFDVWFEFDVAMLKKGFDEERVSWSTDVPADTTVQVALYTDAAAAASEQPPLTLHTCTAHPAANHFWADEVVVDALRGHGNGRLDRLEEACYARIIAASSGAILAEGPFVPLIEVAGLLE